MDCDQLKHITWLYILKNLKVNLIFLFHTPHFVQIKYRLMEDNIVLSNVGTQKKINKQKSDLLLAPAIFKNNLSSIWNRI